MFDEFLNVSPETLLAAEERLRGVLNKCADNGHARQLLGYVLMAADRPDEARREFEYASVLVPLQAEAQLLLADCYSREGQLPLSIEMLMHLTERPDATLHTLRRAAMVADGFDHPWIARGICTRALRRFPDDAEVYHELGYYCGRMGDRALMETHARKAIDLEPEHVGFRVALAGMLVKQDRLDDAYDVVRTLEAGELDQVCCGCCLKRLETVFAHHGDFRRVAMCRERIDRNEGAEGCG